MHIIITAVALSRRRGRMPAAPLPMDGDCPVPDQSGDHVTPTWKRRGARLSSVQTLNSALRASPDDADL